MIPEKAKSCIAGGQNRSVPQLCYHPGLVAEEVVLGDVAEEGEVGAAVRADGEGTGVADEFGEEAEPLYPRLTQYFRMLMNCGFVEMQKKCGSRQETNRI